jgi:hypothetical protein
LSQSILRLAQSLNLWRIPVLAHWILKGHLGRVNDSNRTKTDSVMANSLLKESGLMLVLVLLEAHKSSDLNEHIANIEISDNHHNK